MPNSKKKQKTEKGRYAREMAEHKPKLKKERIHVPTKESRLSARSMSACGIPQERIAELMGIALRTLRKYYQAEINGAIENLLDSAVRGLAFHLRAKKPWAICFTLKTRGKIYGWSERKELTGADGRPLDLRGLTDEQLRTLQEAERIVSEINARGGAEPAIIDPRKPPDQAES